MTITKYIAILKDPVKRQTLIEIDLLTAQDQSLEQQKELIDLLVALSRHVTPKPDIPHQIKSIKLRGNFPITYSQLLAIINSGIEHFWLCDCKISLEETFTGRIFEEKFVHEAKRVELLRNDNILLGLKLENCQGLNKDYLSYLLTRLRSLQKLSLANSDFGPNTGEIVTNFRLFRRRNSSSSPNKSLIRQPNHFFFSPTYEPTTELTVPESSITMRRFSFSDTPLGYLGTILPTTLISSRSNSSNSASTATPPDTPTLPSKIKKTRIEVTKDSSEETSDDSSSETLTQHNVPDLTLNRNK